VKVWVLAILPCVLRLWSGGKGDSIPAASWSLFLYVLSRGNASDAAIMLQGLAADGQVRPLPAQGGGADPVAEARGPGAGEFRGAGAVPAMPGQAECGPADQCAGCVEGAGVGDYEGARGNVQVLLWAPRHD